ncbi:GNAT family N-acetyltransferase [Thalassospira sp. TSL5-1]|uniref:GNAT family N-acetyltransferase n=1 Tax=Thalassospira sp. TSL5-1 TaxID=1544451 RepID=UPI000966F7AC|nr:GNAT family N-acetyltransferase [Thalassospira sp. TSL5-1]OKH89288.1 GNAT family acetyltransferase [Thalassospira sp. TSL5-1]
MLESPFHLVPAEIKDAADLAELRVLAMRPSLEAVGRFDPIRARERFLSTFVAADTKIVYRGEERAGFFVVRQHKDHLYLDHLYVDPKFQGTGIGKSLLEQIKADAQARQFPVRLVALNGSPANRFYQACGFQITGTDDLDTHYIWHP